MISGSRICWLSWSLLLDLFLNESLFDLFLKESLCKFRLSRHALFKQLEYFFLFIWVFGFVFKKLVQSTQIFNFWIIFFLLFATDLPSKEQNSNLGRVSHEVQKCCSKLVILSWLCLAKLFSTYQCCCTGVSLIFSDYVKKNIYLGVKHRKHRYTSCNKPATPDTYFWVFHGSIFTQICE